MESRDNYLPCTFIKFGTPQHPKEPSSIQFAFKDQMTSAAAYSILLENFNDDQLKLRFNEVGVDFIDLDILEIKTNKWITGCKTPVDKKSYQDFTDYVSPTENYMVLFGFFDGEDFIPSLFSGDNNRVVTFLGYENAPSA